MHFQILFYKIKKLFLLNGNNLLWTIGPDIVITIYYYRSNSSYQSNGRSDDVASTLNKLFPVRSQIAGKYQEVQ